MSAPVLQRIESDADYTTYARLRNGWFPLQPTTGARMRASAEAMPPGVPMCRYLVHREAEFLGAGMSLRPYWFADPHLFEVFTAPEDGPHMAERFAEMLRALEDVVLGLGARRARTMISSVRPEIAEVLRSDGYVETDRSPVTMAKLDPAAPPAPPTPEAVAATGIHIQPLSWWIEEVNPMLTLNLELGYRPVYDQIVYTKVL